MPRPLRFLVSLIISFVLLVVILPYVGIPQTHFLPPPLVYQKATSWTEGDITGLRYVPSSDPFRIGDRNYFCDYTFWAPKMGEPPGSKHRFEYTGTVRLPDRVSYLMLQDTPPPYLRIRYEATYPWINGVDDPPLGVGCGEGSNILSGWLIWVGAVFVLALIFTAIINHFSRDDF